MENPLSLCMNEIQPLSLGWPSGIAKLQLGLRSASAVRPLSSHSFMLDQSGKTSGLGIGRREEGFSRCVWRLP